MVSVLHEKVKDKINIHQQNNKAAPKIGVCCL